jgi:signal transduction histidine kinase
MNAMLAQLQASAERPRRFVGDAAHELCTPLAPMRAELEVDRAHPASADGAATAASTLAETIAPGSFSGCRCQPPVIMLCDRRRGGVGGARPSSE